eukprot:PhM_4_TR2073/c0_g1_i1/m.80693
MSGDEHGVGVRHIDRLGLVAADLVHIPQTGDAVSADDEAHGGVHGRREQARQMRDVAQRRDAQLRHAHDVQSGDVPAVHPQGRRGRCPPDAAANKPRHLRDVVRDNVAELVRCVHSVPRSVDVDAIDGDARVTRAPEPKQFGHGAVVPELDLAAAGRCQHKTALRRNGHKHLDFRALRSEGRHDAVAERGRGPSGHPRGGAGACSGDTRLQSFVGQIRRRCLLLLVQSVRCRHTLPQVLVQLSEKKRHPSLRACNGRELYELAQGVRDVCNVHAKYFAEVGAHDQIRPARLHRRDSVGEVHVLRYPHVQLRRDVLSRDLAVPLDVVVLVELHAPGHGHRPEHHPVLLNVYGRDEDVVGGALALRLALDGAVDTREVAEHV